MLSTYRPGDTFLIKKAANTYHTNDIIYFRYPAYDTVIPLTLCLQRLIGLPGDTIEIKDKNIFINNYLIKDTASIKFNYFIKSKVKLDSNFIVNNNLLEGGAVSSELDYSYSLTKEEAEKMSKQDSIVKTELKKEPKGVFDETVFPYSTLFSWNMDNFGKLYIPKKHDTLHLDSLNILLYIKLLTEFENNELEIKRDSIFINNNYTRRYIVKHNYYFVLGDNRDNANDSRVFGFLPESYIKGKVISLLKRK
ncbi:MAG: hypothetical protein JWO32_1417 [Bacteroidetes bacterium]|nr:hypothetical protein [Bacteroidota bacterium]